MFIAINTQPLIAQPVNALARFMTTANSELYVLAKGVLRYLKGVKSRKIIWCVSRVKFPFVPCEIYAYSDASWADIVPQRKSSLSYLIFCNNAVFSWKTSLSSVLAMSSPEAELIGKFQRTLKALRATLAISPSLHQSGHRKHQSNQTQTTTR
jgi:hypothetical protein